MSETVKLKGTIIKVNPNTRFNVLLENNIEIQATISGKMRINNIRIFNGDKVLVELSVYDLTNGRIIRRL